MKPDCLNMLGGSHIHQSSYTPLSCSASCVDVCVDGATTFRSPDCSLFMCDPQLHTRDVHVQRRPMTHARMTLTVAVMRPPLVVSAAGASSACSAAERCSVRRGSCAGGGAYFMHLRTFSH